jgi:diguanylate cyclase (GGDEF)-like protein
MTERAPLPSADRLLAIIELQNEIAAAQLDLDAVLRVVVERAGTLTAATAAMVELVEGDELVYRAVSGTATPSLGLRLRRGASLSGRCVELGVPLCCDDAAVDPRVDQQACRRVGVRSMICVPLLHRGEALGVLKVASSSAHAFGPVDIETLKLLAAVIAAALHHAAQFEATRYRSLHDPLTELPNRRALDEQLQRELERYRRHGTPLSIALLDLDGFKGVNDRWGHRAGDEVLRRVAHELIRAIRSLDRCFRIGGDEFVLLLPDTPAAGAQVVVARCSAAIRGARLAEGSIGVSAGIAQAAGESLEQLLERADLAMYEAKRTRR